MECGKPLRDVAAALTAITAVTRVARAVWHVSVRARLLLRAAGGAQAALHESFDPCERLEAVLWYSKGRGADVA